jgi:hypothetical protein
MSLNKVLIPKAAAICLDIELGPEAKHCLRADPAPVDFLHLLLEQRLYADAVRFLARALPKREAVWWACLCARGTLNETSAPEYINALAVAEAWVYKPTEPNRRQANAAAQAAGFDNAAAWAAMAAFWSDGSLAPENLPVVPPADNLASKAVAGAVMLAAVLKQPEKAPDKYTFFIQQAIDIANGGNGQVWQG